MYTRTQKIHRMSTSDIIASWLGVSSETLKQRDLTKKESRRLVDTLIPADYYGIARQQYLRELILDGRIDFSVQNNRFLREYIAGYPDYQGPERFSPDSEIVKLLVADPRVRAKLGKFPISEEIMAHYYIIRAKRAK